MGYSFSNIHIKKRDGMTPRQVQDALCGYLTDRGYRLVGSKEESDFALFVLNADSAWLSVCCDAVDFSEVVSVKAVCEPLSSSLHTDVIASACFDSDLLFLNLINTEEKVDACFKTGIDEAKAFPRRAACKPWTGRVSDIDSFRQLLKKEYVFAEEAWDELEPLLRMRPHQGTFSEELLDEFEPEQLSVIYFASSEEQTDREPPKLSIEAYDLMPCKLGENKIITAYNTGGASKGLAIAFSGGYVETGDITFHDVQLEYAFDRYPRKTVPLSLERLKTADGRWVYYAAVPDFKIPEKAKSGLPFRKEMDEKIKRSFGVRFTPEGGPRKRLDICVHFIPLSDGRGQCSWCVWHSSGSKKAFIDAHNKTWMRSSVPNLQEILLDPADFDDV